MFKEVRLSSDSASDDITVNELSIGATSLDPVCYNEDIIATVDNPVQQPVDIVELKGNLCELGAIIKPSPVTLH